MHHSKSIRESKLELQSGNPQFGSKLAIFLSHVTLTFDGWPSKTIWHLFYTTLSFANRFKAMGEFKLELQSGNARVKIGDLFVPCDLEIWQMTLENNRASLLYYLKLCASFQSHQWIQTVVTTRSAQFGSKLMIFLSRMILKFDRWPWETIGHIVYATSSFLHHFVALVDSNWSYSLKKA